MRTGRDIKEPPTRTLQRRRTLSNITNLSLSASWAADPREGLKPRTPSKTISFTESQLREENTALKRLLSDKEATIDSQAAQLDQMQKEFFAQLRRQTQVNEELISYNSRLSKDGAQLRDQLKLLQHEYCQMTVAYRINQNELQIKLTESQHAIGRLLERENKSSTDESVPGKLLKKLRSSAHRRHSIASIVLDEDWNDSTKVDSRSQHDGVKKSDICRRLPSVSKDKTGGSRQTPLRADDQVAAVPIRAPNLYCDLIGLDPMPEGSCEEDTDSPRASSEEASSNASDDCTKGGKAGSSLTSEFTSRRRKSGCSDSTPALGKEGAGLGNTRKSDQRASATVSSSVSSSGPTPHFSRRVAINSNLSTENGRPLRRAVVKVASYTEPSLNTKMRRPS